VALTHFGAVAQEQGRVAQDPADVEPRDGESLRLGVREEASDDVIEPLGFAQHDIHQLRLLLVQLQVLPQDLNRARNRRQRIPDLMCDAGRHLPHRASRCCSRASRCIFFTSVTSWKLNRNPAGPEGVTRCVAPRPISITRPPAVR